MPLYPGGSRVGLGLWNSVPATILVEVPMFVLGLWIYGRATRARDARGRWGFATFAAALVAIYIREHCQSAAVDDPVAGGQRAGWVCRPGGVELVGGSTPRGYTADTLIRVPAA